MEIINKSFGILVQMDAIIMNIPCQIFGSKNNQNEINLITVLDLHGNNLHVVEEFKKEIFEVLRESFN